MTRYSKFRAVKTTVDGITFDSKKEAARYQVLKNAERDGMITGLSLQVPFPLIEKSEYGREIRYVADFCYTYKGKYIVEDVKGIKTPVYRLKKRMMAEYYGVVIKET